MNTANAARTRVFDRVLDAIEKLGNKLPDPAVLFLIALGLTWVGSWLLAGTRVEVPKAGGGADLLEVQNQLSGTALVTLLTRMVREFVTFPPLGVVLVAMLGLGVADKSGFISAGLKRLLGFTPRFLLTPMTIAVGLLSLVAVDAGYVLVIPLGGVIFYAAGRHPIAGIAAAFAAVSGGFCASYLPTALDTILAGLTETGARIVDPAYRVNPLCNYSFTIASAILIVLLGWFITPLMPYFPLIVSFTQKYHRGTGIGTLVSVMLPYSVGFMGFMVVWTLFLLAYWGLGLPLGLGAAYTYPAS